MQHFSNSIGSYSIHFSTKSLLLMEILSSEKDKLFFAQMLRVQASKNQISLKSSRNAWPGIHIGLNPTVLSGGRNFSYPLVSEVFGWSQHFQSPPSLHWAADVPALKRSNSMLTNSKIFLAAKYYSYWVTWRRF